MSLVRSGIPRTLPSGVIVGGTDFREFTPQSDWPVGITGYGGSTAIRAVLDESGVGEGNVIQQNTAAAHVGMGIDAYDNIVGVPFEILTRGYIQTASGSGNRMRFGCGPFSLDTGLFDDWDGVLFQSFSNTIRWQGVTILGGAAQATGQTAELDIGDPSGGFNPFYFWLRLRLEASGLNARWRANFTFSDFDSPPAVPGVWDIDETSTGDDAALILAANSIFGWVRSTIGPTQVSDRRMSFLSFSTDPTFTEPPPLPTEVLDQDTVIIPPTVVVDPLQDDWVGLIGSTFETF